MRQITFAASFSIAFFLAAPLVAAPPEGGMFPINMINNVPLRQAGLRITTSDIFKPTGEGGLVRAVVNVGGCTGSFVSDEGLILTNHHCAFGSLQQYSTPDNNLLESGYLANDKTKELPIKDLTVKILESYMDVSEQVLEGTENLAPEERKKAIEEHIRRIKAEESALTPQYTVDINEMLPGKSYLLFRYVVLRDIRIVFIPARNIGEFGGDTDNWEWPRHNADFSFLRAYVDKDGKSAPYSPANVPYRPKEYLNINKDGVQQGDFVFILGYPGRTFQHQPVQFIQQQYNYTLPIISQSYEWIIDAKKSIGARDARYMISVSPEIKQLANVEKNYKGKLKTIAAINLTEQHHRQDRQIAAHPAIGRQYRQLLNSYDSLYQKINATYPDYLRYRILISQSDLFPLGYTVYTWASHLDTATDKAATGREAVAAARRHYAALRLEFEEQFLAQQSVGGNIPAVRNSILLDSTRVIAALREGKNLRPVINDALLNWILDSYERYRILDSMNSSYQAAADALLPRYVDLRMTALGSTFVPDANRTLRLTYGHIKPYRPADAVTYLPFTTLRGMVEKEGLAEDYQLSEQLQEHLENLRKTSDSAHQKAMGTRLCMIYNTHTTGGNSGSPVLNQYGQLIGLNFDRAYEATVNDYAWNDDYSRSIGVDIRFVLWVTDELVGAKHLITEMFLDADR